MRFIVDTHVWLWWNQEPERLSKPAQDLLENPENQVCLSAASVWEMAIKHGLGKLRLPQPIRQYVLTRVARDGHLILDITGAHALESSNLPPHHRDPFDRMLIAQARIERIPILTADPMLRKYAVKTIPAD
jgi:PIN domain nuclease of toxin-antitoxin system